MISQVRSTTVSQHQDTDSSLSKLKKVCSDFESMLLTIMLKSMSSGMADVGLFGKTHESKLMRSMMDEHLAVEIAQKGGTGLGAMLFEKLKNSKNFLNSSPKTADK
jgi:Rod binding domain-containing protein